MEPRIVALSPRLKIHPQPKTNPNDANENHQHKGRRKSNDMDSCIPIFTSHVWASEALP
jgi:hypothetical protein